MDLASVILALAAAVAPAFVAMISHYRRATEMLDECLTLREHVAFGLSQCWCRDPQRVQRILSSIPCAYIDREASSILPMAATALLGVIVIFLFYMVVEDLFWKMLFAASAAALPYVALFSVVRGLPVGVFAPARVFVASRSC